MDFKGHNTVPFFFFSLEPKFFPQGLMGFWLLMSQGKVQSLSEQISIQP